MVRHIQNPYSVCDGGEAKGLSFCDHKVPRFNSLLRFFLIKPVFAEPKLKLGFRLIYQIKGSDLPTLMIPRLRLKISTGSGRRVLWIKVYKC